MRNPLRKRDPAAEAETTVTRIDAQRQRLADRLAGAEAAVTAAQAARRQALVEGDPDPAEMRRLDQACADASEAHAGIAEAARAVATQLEDAIRERDALIDRDRRAEVSADCKRRADAIDDAARGLAAAAEAFADASAAMVTTITDHGIAKSNILAAPEGLSPRLLAQPVIRAALRKANPEVPIPTFGPPGVATVVAEFDPVSADPLITARRTQSGLLRDHADDVRDGRCSPVSPARPQPPASLVKVQIPETAIVLKHGIEYLGEHHRLIPLGAGNASIPAPVAEAAIRAGVGFRPGTAEAVQALRDLEPGLAKENGIDPKTGKPARLAFAAFTRLDVNLADWIEAERARLSGSSA